MKLFRFAILLLVQLSPIFVHGNGETEYKCAEVQTARVTVQSANAQLTKGCVQKGKGIRFVLKDMYDAAAVKKTPKTPVVINICEAAFIDSYIKVINASTTHDAGPLLFTMSKSNMSETSRLEFGFKGQPFKLPPNSRIRIIDSELTLLSADRNYYIFTFHGLQLEANSSMEIAHNVITMKCIRCTSMAVFYLPTGPGMKVSDKSSFTLLDNEITITGESTKYLLRQYVWYQDTTSVLTISENSIYTWASNNISMMGFVLGVGVWDKIVGLLTQYVWYLPRSPLTISGTSKYTWASNNISMVGCGLINSQSQYVWYQDSTSLTIYQKSIYTWISNIISILGYNGTEQHHQYVWYQGSASPLTISQTSTYTWASNNISMMGYNLNVLYQYVFYQLIKSHLTISQSSNYTLLMNNISMDGHDVIKFLTQVVLTQGTDSDLTISQTSKYTWASNIITMVVYKVPEKVDQSILMIYTLIAISVLGQFLFESNRILLLAKDYGSIESYVMRLEGSGTSTISDKSSMVWKNNFVGMGHKETDKRHVFGGKWTIKDGSDLLLDGNYITTTEDNGPSGGELTQLVWGLPGETSITISTGALTIRNTKVYANSGATGSMMWVSSSFTSKANVKQLAMDWGSFPAMDNSGTLIPTLDNSNLRQYMCVAFWSITPTVTLIPALIEPNLPETKGNSQTSNAKPDPSQTGGNTAIVPKPVSPNTGPTTARKPPKPASNPKTTKAKVISATALLSTIPAVLITSVVFLYLYNW